MREFRLVPLLAVLCLLLFFLPWLPAMAQTCVDDYPASTPTADFTDNGDGTVTHKKTGLTWMRCSLGQSWNGSTCTGSVETYTWQDALDKADAWNTGGGYAGHTDWRVPTVNELRSIIETKCYDPSINISEFPGITYDWHYWSSSPSPDDSDYAGYVYFNVGHSKLNYNRGLAGAVRLVRGGQWLLPLDLQDQTGVTVNQEVTSNSVVLDNVANGAVVSITGGSYSLNEDAFTSLSGTVRPGDRVRVRTTSSAQYATATQATLTVGDSRLTFTVTTRAESQICDTTISASTPTSAFTDHGDGTVTHRTTGLTWMRCALGQTWNGTTCTGSVMQEYAWQPAQDAADAFNARGGYVDQTDWRVPTKSELDTIVEPQCSSPTINMAIFPNSSPNLHWSSSPSVKSSYAWFVAFGFGSSYFIGNTSPSGAVRLVRGNQWFMFFDLQDQSGIALNRKVISNEITLENIPDGTAINITGGSYSINNGAFTKKAGTVKAGDQVRVQVTSSSQYGTSVTATLTIGDVSSDFIVTTRAAPALDTTPDAFSFTPSSGAGLRQTVTSKAITVSGIDAPTDIGIRGGTYSINGKPFTKQAGKVKAGFKVRVRLTTSDQYSTPTSATLTIGGVTGDFTVTTKASPADTTPDPFSFTAVTGAEPNQQVTSNTIDITGIDAPAAIAIQGGTYSIGNGAFTNAPGTVDAGDEVQVRLTASPDYNASVTATLTIGGVGGDFTVTTRKEPAPCDASVSWTQGTPVALELPLPISTEKSYGQSLAATCEWLWIGAPQLTYKSQKNRGAVFWWHKTEAGAWESLSEPESQGAAGDGFGSALAMNEAWAAVGAPKAMLGDFPESGRVYLYQAQNQTWLPLASPLTTPGFRARERFGASLALSDAWLAVGAPGTVKGEGGAETHGDGAVYLYALQQGAWTYRQTLTSSNAEGRFGASVGMDGNRLIVGAPTEMRDTSDNRGSGTVYAYRLDGEQWSPDTRFPLPDLNYHRDGQLGTALALQGNTLVISAPLTTIPDPVQANVTHPLAGRVFLYRWDAAAQAWYLSENPLNESGDYLTTEDRFGSSLALADQGQWLIVGAPGADPSNKTLANAGRGYLYQIAGYGGAVVQRFAGTAKNQGLGRSAAMLPNTAFVGTQAGQVWSYQPE